MKRSAPEKKDRLVKEVERRIERRRLWDREGEPSVGRRLAQIGVLGWIIVVPTLVGLFFGRWLDRIFATGIFWTGPLLLAGLALGCWSAWKWVNNA